MPAYLLRRLLVLPLVLLAVSFTALALVRLAPGDPAVAIVGEKAPRAERERVTRALGLDRPIFVQYAVWLGGALRGDLGVSHVSRGRPIAEEIAERFPRTIELTASAMAIAVVLGMAFGILSAVYARSFLDYLGMTVALFGLSIPVFWLGMVLVVSLGRFFATGGNLSPELSVAPVTRFLLLDCALRGDGRAFLDALNHLVLPACALATIPMAMIARFTRAALREALSSDYVRTARAKGLSPRAVVLRHALKNALPVVLTMIGLEFGYLLGGAMLTESVFDWPGMGHYLNRALDNRDHQALLAALAVACSSFVVVNLFVDLAHAALDPRVRG